VTNGEEKKEKQGENGIKITSFKPNEKNIFSLKLLCTKQSDKLFNSFFSYEEEGEESQSSRWFQICLWSLVSIFCPPPTREIKTHLLHQK